MTRSKHHRSQTTKWLKNNEKGQVSVFFGISLVAIFSLIAFVVNVGLFVKAKINLQNAVDSAAWSGAAAQSRQLTTIAHLNWEMRNTFKEWMFKYYILGQLANENTHSSTGDTSNFVLRRFDTSANDLSGGVKGDHYNVPSICLHFGDSENLCTIYQIPGLPRFHVAGIPDVSEEFESTIDAFVTQKAKNCAVRSTYNFSAAQNYAFAAGQSTNDIPIAAAGRTGAWIEAMEIALRMRNLEMVVNRPPIENGICENGATAGCTELNSLISENASYQFAFNDRPIKAFSAAFKTLSGGQFKGSTAFENTFVLFELAPKTFKPSPTSLSSFLIPQDASYTNGELVVNSKRYLDLVPMLMNYTTFFTVFSPTTEGIGTIIGGSDNTAAEASCTSTKTAMPVPGYILGFYKNPKVVTYYAVKGTAEYHALLNPFQKTIPMSAYAAAKPFGARIGPSLVGPVDASDYEESSANIPREINASGSRTANYIMGFSTAGDPRATGATPKIQGLPLPANEEFFLGESDTATPVGGIPTSIATKFTIPNLIYDLNSETESSEKLPVLKYNANPSTPTSERSGLFTSAQFFNMRNNIPGYTPGQAGLAMDSLIEAFKNVRAPTNYDLINYTVPTLKNNESATPGEHLSNVAYLDSDLETVGYMAPLFHPNLLYKDKPNLVAVFISYIESLEASVVVYRKALKEYADVIRTTTAQQADAYEEAANAIFDNTIDGTPETTTVSLPITDCPKQSIASRFTYFLLNTEQFEANSENCDTVPLLGRVVEYVNAKGSDNTSNYFYIATHRQNPENPSGTVTPTITNEMIRTSYVPGPEYGAGVDGTSTNPFTGRSKRNRRSGYSTKLISLRSVFDNSIGGYAKAESNYVEFSSTFSPGGSTPLTPSEINTGGDTIKNPLNPADLSEFGSEIYF